MPLSHKPEPDALWKDEFSIYTADERCVSRRQFTKFLTLASMGMFGGNLWILVRSYFAKAAGDEPSRLPVPSGILFRGGRLRAAGSAAAAIAPHCTRTARRQPRRQSA